jgi:poly-gamma-glutamate synthesis protein (capsule biosynthesis protein)
MSAFAGAVRSTSAVVDQTHSSPNKASRVPLTLLCALLLYPLLAVAADAPPSDNYLAKNWIDANVPDGFTVVSVGDLIITTPIFQRMQRTSPELIRLLQSGNVGFGNFEGSVLDVPKFDGYPAALSGGSWLLSSPKVPFDLKEMGFNLVSRANNHATDYGVRGMISTDEFFDEAGVIHAGTGKTLSQARAPQILSIPAGRISLVALTSAFNPDSPASDPFGQFGGRPGVNALHTTRYAMVSADELAMLAKIRDSEPAGSVAKSSLALDAKADAVTLFGAHYKARRGPGDELSFSFAMDERDHREIIRAIRQGKESSDFSIVSVHTHEPGNYSREPPDFLVALAHEAIDNGADALVMHGPHQLRGIEIHKGRPIFYSLGNFFFMVSTMQPLTRDEYELEDDPTSSGGHVEP